MPPSERDLSYLIDMVVACRDIQEFASDVTFEEFAADKMRRSATERQLEVLGEAANHVSDETQQNLPNIEWAKIIALRNRLAHEYGDVLAQRIWQIVAKNVPELLKSLLAIEDVKNADSHSTR